MWHQELKRLRLAERLTQEELARDIGIDQTTVSSVETGRREPGTDVLQRWVHRCGGRVEVVGRGEMALSDVPKDLLPDVATLVRRFVKADPETRKAILLILRTQPET
jgi:transcriptional regulator with XRE-family HTH domain